MLPLDPFGRSRVPDALSREGRIRMLARAAAALLEGQLPDPAARLYLGAAISSWLREGGRVGDLERRYLQVTAKERSRMTPARLLARCARTATPGGEAGTMPASDDASLDGEQADDD